MVRRMSAATLPKTSATDEPCPSVLQGTTPALVLDPTARAPAGLDVTPAPTPDVAARAPVGLDATPPPAPDPAAPAGLGFTPPPAPDQAASAPMGLDATPPPAPDLAASAPTGLDSTPPPVPDPAAPAGLDVAPPPEPGPVANVPTGLHVPGSLHTLVAAVTMLPVATTDAAAAAAASKAARSETGQPLSLSAPRSTCKPCAVSARSCWTLRSVQAAVPPMPPHACPISSLANSHATASLKASASGAQSGQATAAHRAASARAPSSAHACALAAAARCLAPGTGVEKAERLDTRLGAGLRDVGLHNVDGLTVEGLVAAKLGRSKHSVVGQGVAASDVATLCDRTDEGVAGANAGAAGPPLAPATALAMVAVFGRFDGKAATDC